MSDTDGQSFERTKLRKQLTQRKRGKEPSAAASSAAEETKSAASATSKGVRKPWFFSAYMKKYAPSYLMQRPTSKMAFDFAFFTVSAIVIMKLGQ